MNEKLVSQLMALAILVGTLVLMGYGFAVMAQAVVPNASQRYLRWAQRTFVIRPINCTWRVVSRQAGRLVTWLLNQVQAFLAWVLRQIWRLTRYSFTALRRGIAGLL